MTLFMTTNFVLTHSQGIRMTRIASYAGHCTLNELPDCSFWNIGRQAVLTQSVNQSHEWFVTS